MLSRIFKKNKKSWRNIGVILCFFIMITVPVTTSFAETNNVELTDKDEYSDNYIIQKFTFLQPQLSTTDINDNEYTNINLKGCISMGKFAGQPMMPVKNIKILLPPLKNVENVEINGNPIELDLDELDLKEKPIFPYQNNVIIGDTSVQEFEIDNSIYSSDSKYPSSIYEDYLIGYSHGYNIFSIDLNPIQYNPKEGKIFYYTELTLKINLKDNPDANRFYRISEHDKEWVKSLVINPEMTEYYTTNIPTFEYPGGLCDPTDHYDYVIITTTHNGLDYWSTGGSLVYNWNDLMDKHESDDGFNCNLVTIQDIDACTDYHSSNPLFNDQEAHIREFCKDAYQDWETEYILIGGDDEWIPAREMETNYEGYIDSDIYWSNLDSTFNEDGDNYWGEAGDGGFDLYAEIYIGRLTCDEPQDVSNWMTKSFYYADSTDIDFLDSATFYGGNTGWSCQGDDFEDFSAIKGTDDWLGPDPHYDGPWPSWLGFLFGFETWNIVNPNNQFNLTEKWTAEPPNPGWKGGNEFQAINGLKSVINNDQAALISGIAHASASSSLDVYYDEWESDYHNTKPFFIHDYGCHCGDMDAADDGVLHSMLFHSDTELAFACVYNTCYGWGNLYCTNSSSALQQKLFWDFLLDTDNNSGDYGNWQLGKAHAWTKDMMAPTINWDPYYDTWRAIIQGCLLFGDPAQKLKTPNPSDPPEQPAKPNGPSRGIIYYDITFSAKTTDPNNDQIYYMFNWGDGNNSGWIGPYSSGATISASYAWTALGDYDVKVKAKDFLGAGSIWSEPLKISIVDNIPPDAPSINGQSTGAPNITYLYKFNSVDLDNHDVYYYVDWGDGTFTDWEGPFKSSFDAGISHTYTEKGTFTIKAKARDELGDESDWGTLEISVPLNKQILRFPILHRIIELFPNGFPLLRQILGM